MPFSFFQQIQKRNRDFEIEIEGCNLPVKVTENDRAKRLTLRIVPGGDGLKVTTPCHIGDDEIEAFVERNSNWVAAKIARLPKKTKISAGASIPFKGIDHKIELTGNLRGLVRATDLNGYRCIEVPGTEATVGRKLVSWLKQEARTELNKAVSRHSNSLGVRAKQIRITDTTSRWGSCSSTRTLSFSWRVIMAPPEVLDYLAAHEVAHLVEMNHSERFWTLTKRLCPEMDVHKDWLRQHGSKLHAVHV